MPEVPDVALAAELRRRGIRPNRRLGQNFMVDRQMLDFLVRTAGVCGDDLVLEVGTGAGFLTQRLCEYAAHVVSIEIDAGLYGLARERLAGFGNLTLIHCDALSGEHSWSPAARRALDDAIARHEGSRLKLVANLPYGIATAVVQTVLECGLPFAGAWFTCQKEVAQRLTAPPGDAEYGFVSVLVALLADIHIVRGLPASVFWPRPSVESAIVEFTIPEERRVQPKETEGLRTILSQLFTQRRRQLSAVLRSFGLDQDATSRLDDTLARFGGTREERVFRLTPPALKAIAQLLAERNVGSTACRAKGAGRRREAGQGPKPMRRNRRARET
jgi:16S rRNA (adenine1518-N6/adenine1519-N6)-dimethyltransferase